MDIKEIKIKSKITMLKMKLQQTDYQAIKYAEGELTLEEFAETKEKRKQWREEINALQAGLKALKGE
jgi:hypothetical protein